MTYSRLFILAALVLSSTSAFPQTADSGRSRIQFLGHASFNITAPGGARIIVDPYNNACFSHWFDGSFPGTDADVVVSTHSHFDHGAIHKVAGATHILAEAGSIADTGYQIVSIEGRHAKPERYGTENRIVVIDVGGVRIVHWGDNGSDIDDGLLAEIGPVDMLMIPFDESEHVLTREQVVRIRTRLNPRVVVPVHYYVSGLTSICSTLQDVSHWLDTERRVRRIPEAGLTLTYRTNRKSGSSKKPVVRPPGCSLCFPAACSREVRGWES